MTDHAYQDLVSLDIQEPIWERFFTVNPLVLVGTRDPGGEIDLAPKHMAFPMGWDNYFGFVCSPSHATAANIERTGEFTVSYPRPSQLLFTSLAASPRQGDGKPVLSVFQTFPAARVDGELLTDAYLHLECTHHATFEGFGRNILITGQIVAAHVAKDALRSSDRDDQQLVHNSPLVSYLHPGRFFSIADSNAFPFPKDMKK
ncbi:MAG: flavin reductase [Xanthomonadales bacterium]|nr:flavin reductase [Xanthomonadales bacterium]